MDEGAGVIVVGDEGERAGGVEGRAEGAGDAARGRSGGVCALAEAEGDVCPGEVEHCWWLKREGRGRVAKVKLNVLVIRSPLVDRSEQGLRPFSGQGILEFFHP